MPPDRLIAFQLIDMSHSFAPGKRRAPIDPVRTQCPMGAAHAQAQRDAETSMARNGARAALSCLAPMPRSPEHESEAAEPRLDSWKEIASYLRRGIRTVQRWEREEGLPVHRLDHAKRGSVYAIRSELTAWWESRRRRNAAPRADGSSRTIRDDQPTEFGTRDQDVGGDILAVAVVGRAHDRVRLGCREGRRIAAGMAAADWRGRGPAHLGPTSIVRSRRSPPTTHESSLLPPASRRGTSTKCQLWAGSRAC